MSYNVAQTTNKTGNHLMTTNAVVRARIDARIKAEASAVLNAIGLTVSDAFRLLLTRVAVDKALPFEPLIPNAKTIAAMKAARQGKLTNVKLDDLLDRLNADD
jgi:DNA-damage-inducible protein J